jgi:sortase B
MNAENTEGTREYKVENEVEVETGDEEKNIFFDSLKSMTPNDIDLNETAKNAKKPSIDFVRYFVLVVSLAVFLYSGYEIVTRLYGYVEARGEYADLQKMTLIPGDFAGSQSLKKTRANVPIKDHMALQRQQTRNHAFGAEISEWIDDEVPPPRVNSGSFRDINSDFYCWIRVSQTTIDYPVVQTTNNDYYLNYSFRKVRNAAGAIFADHRNSKDIGENRNMVIYGHNMLDNSMFQPLIIFGSRWDYFKNGIIELSTEEATYYYEVFSAREADPSSGYIQVDFDSDEEYIEFLYEMQECSNFNKYLEFDAESKIVTLSTCVNDYKRDWRFVVQGVLFDIR